MLMFIVIIKRTEENIKIKCEAAKSLIKRRMQDSNKITLKSQFWLKKKLRFHHYVRNIVGTSFYNVAKICKPIV